MESYNNFVERIDLIGKNSVDKTTNPMLINTSIANKNNDDGTFKNLYGDTVIFYLDAKENAKVVSMIETLHDRLDYYLAEKLNEYHRHMTLHDLTNSSNYYDIKGRLQQNQIQVKNIFNTIDANAETIKMDTTYVFNKFNNNIVLGLKPKNEVEYLKLMKLYLMFDSVVSLPYLLLPHVTLAYYTGNNIDYTAKTVLKDTLQELTDKNIEIELNTKRLVYSQFDNMNSFHAM